MLQNIKLSDVLFLDIETVPIVASFQDLPDKFKKLWEKKAELLKRNDSDMTADTLFAKAGIFAEFGKIVCISCGFAKGNEFRLKSFYGDDEALLLNEFADMLSRYYSEDKFLLCAHNGKEFDFPYLCRRMLVHGIELPNILDISGKKPWEIKHLDTMELWKFGDYKHFTSLDLLAAIFGIDTPKDDIDGSMVGHVYWVEKNLERIAAYCQKDVLTIAQLLRRYMGLALYSEKDVVFN
jgi:DNA polymerase elongation subunit (family B)